MIVKWCHLSKNTSFRFVKLATKGISLAGPSGPIHTLPRTFIGIWNQELQAKLMKQKEQKPVNLEVPKFELEEKKQSDVLKDVDITVNKAE